MAYRYDPPAPAFVRATATLDRPHTTGEVIQSQSAGKPIRAVLMTSAKAADGLQLDPRGCDLSRFKRNAVLLEAHDQKRLPIGRVRDIRVEDDRITGVLEFSHSTRGREAEADVRAGYVNAVSIGFDIDKNSRDWRTGKVSKWTLTEVSLVPVPLDAEAMIFERGYKPTPNHMRASYPLRFEEEPDVADFAAVTEPDLRRAVIDLLVRMGIGVNIRGEEVGWTRDRSDSFSRNAKGAHMNDDADADDEDFDDDMDDEDDMDDDEDFDDDMDDEDMDDEDDAEEEHERGYEPEFVRPQELPALLRSYGIRPADEVDQDAATALLDALTPPALTR